MLLTLYMEEQQFYPRHHHHHPEAGDHDHQLDHDSHPHGGDYHIVNISSIAMMLIDIAHFSREVLSSGCASKAK